MNGNSGELLFLPPGPSTYHSRGLRCERVVSLMALYNSDPDKSFAWNFYPSRIAVGDSCPIKGNPQREIRGACNRCMGEIRDLKEVVEEGFGRGVRKVIIVNPKPGFRVQCSEVFVGNLRRKGHHTWFLPESDAFSIARAGRCPVPGRMRVFPCRDCDGLIRLPVDVVTGWRENLVSDELLTAWGWEVSRLPVQILRVSPVFQMDFLDRLG
jgi:hypothetical protein